MLMITAATATTA